MILLNQVLLENILTPILIAVGTALASMLTFGITKLIAWVNRKIGNEKVANAIERIGQIVLVAVETTNQQFVDGLKKEGKFNLEAQKQALELTLKNVKVLLTDELKNTLNEIFGDTEAYLIMLIEQTVGALTP